MNEQLFNFALQAPWLVKFTVIVSSALLLLGWILSIRAGRKRQADQSLRLLLFIPLTNPIALLFLLFTDGKSARNPILVYLLAIASFTFGSVASESIERKKLQNLYSKIETSGESLSIESLIPAPVPDEQNIWMHPFLKPFSGAAIEGKGMDLLPNQLEKLGPIGNYIRPDPKIQYKTLESTPMRRHRIEGPIRIILEVVSSDALNDCLSRC